MNPETEGKWNEIEGRASNRIEYNNAVNDLIGTKVFDYNEPIIFEFDADTWVYRVYANDDEQSELMQKQNEKLRKALSKSS
jgi:hypothetical protein